MFTFESAAVSYVLLRREPGRLKRSDSALVLQRGSEPSSDILVKILGVDTPCFLLIQRCIFSFFHCQFVSLIKVEALPLSTILQLVAFAYCAGGWG
jgi:hypothetical protein